MIQLETLCSCFLFVCFKNMPLCIQDSSRIHHQIYMTMLTLKGGLDTQSWVCSVLVTDKWLLNEQGFGSDPAVALLTIAVIYEAFYRVFIVKYTKTKLNSILNADDSYGVVYNHA